MSPKKQAGSGFNLTQGAACSVFVVSPSFLQHMTNALALLMSIYRERKSNRKPACVPPTESDNK